MYFSVRRINGPMSYVRQCPCGHCYTFFLPLLTASLLDDPDTFKGAPVGLQLVGRTLEEEAVIAMTEIVDAALKELQGSEGTLPHLRASL